MAKQKTMPRPFCGAIMTTTYNAVSGIHERRTIHSCGCSNEKCQLNTEYIGGQELGHRNMKKINKMQSRIAELEGKLTYMQNKLCELPDFIVKQDDCDIFDTHNGQVKEAGVNGCQVDTLIQAALLMLRGLNENEPCIQNENAINKLEMALRWLKDRKHDRKDKGEQ